MLACRQNVEKVCPTLGKNVSPTCQTTCRHDIIQDFANMLTDSFGHKEKTPKLCRKLRSDGMIWCEKVTKMVPYALIHVYVPFFIKKTTAVSIRVMEPWVVDVAGQSCNDMSANMWPSHESSHGVSNMVTLAQFQATFLASWRQVPTCCRQFQLSFLMLSSSVWICLMGLHHFVLLS